MDKVRKITPLPFILICLAIVATILMRMLVFDIYVVPSESMLNTFQVGDMIFGSKIAYLNSEPKSGDIITIKNPEDKSAVLLKRIVATEGQAVDIKDGKLFIDGVEQHESYTIGKSYRLVNEEGKSFLGYPYTVPKDNVFVMGDNRENSKDSRFFGGVNKKDVLSKIEFRYFSFSNIGSVTKY